MSGSLPNALGSIGTKEVIPVLIQVLQSDPEWFARVGAAEGLAMINDERAIAALRQALDDEEANVRKVALDALRTSDPASVAALTKPRPAYSCSPVAAIITVVVLGLAFAFWLWW